MRMILALTALALMSQGALASDAGCWEANNVGDRFVLGSDPTEWTFKHRDGTAETCSYGIDGDSGLPTIQCGKSAFTAAVSNDGKKHLQILGDLWSFACPKK